MLETNHGVFTVVCDFRTLFVDSKLEFPKDEMRPQDEEEKVNPVTNNTLSKSK